MKNEEMGGYLVPRIWAKDGEQVARKEIETRTKLNLPLGSWPDYLKGFQEILNYSGSAE